MRERYGRSINVTKETQKNRTNLNIADNEARVRKERDGETLAAKVETELGDLKKKKVSQLMDDAFYQEIYEDGIPFRVRRTNILRDMKIPKKIKKGAEEAEDPYLHINKTLTVPDDVLQRRLELGEAAEKEAKRDRTYEEFAELYGDHLEGKVDPDLRVGNRPATALMDEMGSRAGEAVPERVEPGADEARESEKASKKHQSQGSQRQGSKGSSHKSGSAKSDYKYDLSNECKLELPKASRIE